ncbi:hypothetical protein NESM_000417300 [Novymonas esmeraldas]|uniref:REH2 DRSM domain-containing protein n=1 Tax=Novymonas esmeraldas TaxID=1808958 RepID=A0AAW0ELG6_9TRYP
MRRSPLAALSAPPPTRVPCLRWLSSSSPVTWRLMSARAASRGRRERCCSGTAARSASHAMPPSALLIERRACSSTTSSSSSTWQTGPPPPPHAGGGAGAVEPELISLDSIVIEVVDPEPRSSTTTARHAEVRSEHHVKRPYDQHPQLYQSSHAQRAVPLREVSATSFFTGHLQTVSGDAPPDSGAGDETTTAAPPQQQSQQQYCDVSVVDAFARGRIINLVRRMGDASEKVFHVRAMAPAQAAAITGDAAVPLFVASCRLPLPAPHCSRVAEGLAEDAKEAELLAAMHAERVCDALGVPIFRLRTAQQKHADAVRRDEGRYAPYPDDPVKPIGTPVPPPLRLLRTVRPPPADVVAGGTATAPAPATDSHARAPQAPLSVPSRSLSSATSATTETATTGAGRCNNTAAAVTPPCAGYTTPMVAVAARRDAGGGGGGGGGGDASRIVLYRHDPLQDYAALVERTTDEAHAARLRSYASTVHYPWMSRWETEEMKQVDSSSSSSGGGGTPSLYDPTEGGMWCVVNDRNCRCSPTPQDALVLPFVYDGPHAEARVADYYTQHGTTLQEQLTVHTTSVSGGGGQRVVEAELRLLGLSITARGRAPTETVAVHLAAMHAELLLDALGHALFPADAPRQARHAEAVAGYGRWATNPITGDTTSPTPHDALPAPLRLQIGADETWLSVEAQRTRWHNWSASQYIVAAMQSVYLMRKDEVEVNPPEQLLTEAVRLLREWQAHVAKSPYTHLFVLVDLNDSFQATTLLPVPLKFGVRGGIGVGRTRESAVQLCALHALDTLTTLGIPICTDAAQERLYLQRRAALGMALPHPMAGDGKAEAEHRQMPHTLSSLRHGPGDASELLPAAGDGTVAHLPMYSSEGSQIRLLPCAADVQRVMKVGWPEDFCLFGAGRETEMNNVGNEVRLAVQNYLHDVWAAKQRHITTTTTATTDVAAASPTAETAVVADGAAAAAATATAAAAATPATAATAAAATATAATATAAATAAAATATAATAAAAGSDAAEVEATMAEAQTMAALLPFNPVPHTIVRGLHKTQSSNNFCFMRVPVPSAKWVPPAATAGMIDATVSASPSPHPACSPVYALAVGLSLKRRDADRACFMHAASILHCFGIDVLTSHERGLPRYRTVTNFAAAARYLGKEPVNIVFPHLPDGTLRVPATAPLDEDGVRDPPPAPAKPKSCSSSFSSPAPPPDVPAAPPGSLHPPRPVMHINMKQFVEDGRGITLPRKRKTRSRLF